MDRVVIDCVDIGATIVQAVVTFKVKAHSEKPVVTGEADAAGDGGVLEANLGPLDKDIAGSQNS